MTTARSTKRGEVRPATTIDSPPMPYGALGELVNDQGGHVGWIVKTEGPVIPIAEVRNGLLMFSHAARQVMSDYEGRRVIVLRVED